MLLHSGRQWEVPQAANIVEGLEAGSKLLLIDEDTSATNFMVRDELMQRVVAREKEPITPFWRGRRIYTHRRGFLRFW